MVCRDTRAVGPPPSSVLFRINYYCLTAITKTATRTTTTTTVDS
jgi:hypothetical protein